MNFSAAGCDVHFCFSYPTNRNTNKPLLEIKRYIKKDTTTKIGIYSAGVFFFFCSQRPQKVRGGTRRRRYLRKNTTTTETYSIHRTTGTPVYHSNSSRRHSSPPSQFKKMYEDIIELGIVCVRRLKSSVSQYEWTSIYWFLFPETEVFSIWKMTLKGTVTPPSPTTIVCAWEIIFLSLGLSVLLFFFLSLYRSLRVSCSFSVLRLCPLK